MDCPHNVTGLYYTVHLTGRVQSLKRLYHLIKTFKFFRFVNSPTALSTLRRHFSTLFNTTSQRGSKRRQHTPHRHTHTQGHVFLPSRWPAAGRLSVSVLCFCPAADLIYGSRWAAYSAPFVAIDILLNRACQLYKNISMLFLFPVKRDLLFTNI